MGAGDPGRLPGGARDLQVQRSVLPHHLRDDRLVAEEGDITHERSHLGLGIDRDLTKEFSLRIEKAERHVADSPDRGELGRREMLLRGEIRDQKQISDDLTKKLKAGLDTYEQAFLADNKASAPASAA